MLPSELRLLLRRVFKSSASIVAGAGGDASAAVMLGVVTEASFDGTGLTSVVTGEEAIVVGARERNVDCFRSWVAGAKFCAAIERARMSAAVGVAGILADEWTSRGLFRL